MLDRSSKIALAIGLALIVVLGAFGWLNSADAMTAITPKCKTDTYIAVVVAAPDAHLMDASTVGVVHDVPGNCRNVPGASDDYDITHNGRPGMHMLASAVAEFDNAVDANPGAALTIEHTVNHVVQPWRSFTPAAVQVLYNGLGH